MGPLTCLSSRITFVITFKSHMSRCPLKSNSIRLFQVKSVSQTSEVDHCKEVKLTITLDMLLEEKKATVSINDHWLLSLVIVTGHGHKSWPLAMVTCGS